MKKFIVNLAKQMTSDFEAEITVDAETAEEAVELALKWDKVGEIDTAWKTSRWGTRWSDAEVVDTVEVPE